MAGIVRRVVEVAGERLDKVLASDPSVGSRRRAREAVETGKVFVDGRIVTPEEAGLPLPIGAVVEVRWNAPGTSMAKKKGEAGLTASGLRILFQDDDVVAVDKPPGLLTDTASVQQARERDSVRKRLGALLRASHREAYVCHRIDRDTSGVVLFATNEQYGQRLREQFANHQPERIYWCAVHGVVPGDAGVWVDSTRWDTGRLKLMNAAPQVPGAMPTRASWKVVERFANATVLEVQLDTGRRNQIRLQAANRGHPLIGERIYLPRGFDIGSLRVPRQALHARRVGFVHPRTGKPVVVESPLAGDLVALVAGLRR